MKVFSTNGMEGFLQDGHTRVIIRENSSESRDTEERKVSIISATKDGRALSIGFKDGRSLTLEDCWLRDHCRCSTCYHADKFQRALHVLDIPDSQILEVRFIETELFVKWDDNHKSQYGSSFLLQTDYKVWSDKCRLKPLLWHGSGVADRVARVHVDKFLGGGDGAWRVFQSLLDYGVALVDGVDATLEATERVSLALGGVQHTMFGGMFKFTSNPDHADSAYSSLALATHNDSTYFTEAAGLLILHCMEHSNGSGGETVLVDGFYGARRLEEEHAEDFKFLSTFDLEAQYIEKGHHHKYSAPVLSVDKKTGDLKQIRFNVYDRSPMAFSSSEECRSYYRSLRSLARYYEDASNQWKFKLEPGVVMVVDNFRVLHGRTAFTGQRFMGGSYVARSDWLDRARHLKLIQ